MGQDALSAGLLLALLGTSAGPALAMTAQDCLYVTTYPERLPYPDENGPLPTRDTRGKMTDFGGGVVGQELVMETQADATTYLMLDHCASGEGIAITLAWTTPEGIARLPQDAYAVVRQAVASPKAFRMRDLARTLDQPITGKPFVTAEETCACAAFYPEVRGSRTAWKRGS